MSFKPANEIKVGDLLMEAHGLLIRVDGVSRKGPMVDLTVNFDQADMLICKPAPDQVKRFKATTRLYVIEPQAQG